MTRAHESFGELTKDLDMDIDDPGERALNILRRERADPTRAPDEPTPLRLKPFDAAPGDETCVVKYTFRNELTTIGEVVEELAEMLGLMPCAVSLVHAGRELGPLVQQLEGVVPLRGPQVELEQPLGVVQLDVDVLGLRRRAALLQVRQARAQRTSRRAPPLT